MRALVMDGFGAVPEAKVTEFAKPACGPTDILVRMGAAGVNPVDWKQIAGFLKEIYPPPGPRWIPGNDGAGIVEAVGNQVKEFKPGDSVFFRSPPTQGTGTFAEYVQSPAAVAWHAPKTIDYAAMACIPTAGVTAYQGLFATDAGNLKAGQSLLIHGAAGGVGSFAVAFAHAKGVKVAATCRSENAKYVEGLGAGLAIDYKKANVVDAAKKWASKGVDVVLDAFSGGAARELFDALAPGGRLVVVATGTADVDVNAMIAEAKQRSLSYHFLLINMETAQKDLARISELIDAGGMKLPEITAFPFEKAADAIAKVQNGGARGKIVIKVADLKR